MSDAIPTLDIVLFGRCWGESILVSVENKYNILIDCFDFSDSSPIRAELKRRDISQLDAIVVTHPHLDHFKDIHLCAREYNPKVVATYALESPKTLNAYFKILDKTLEKSKKKSVWRNFSKYFKRLGKVGEEYEALQCFLEESVRTRASNHVKIMSAHTIIDQRPGLGLEIRTLSPTLGSAKTRGQQLLSILRNIPDDTVSNSGSIDNEIVNSMSVTLLFTWRGKKILLCADTDNANMKEIAKMDLDPHMGGFLSNLAIVKASHHGSLHGNPDVFWEHAGKHKPEIICTYYDQKLPHVDVLKMINRHTGNVVSQPTFLNEENKTSFLGTAKGFRQTRGHPLRIKLHEDGNVEYLR